jgi:Cu-Zn family superoxide dismutase
MKNTVFFRLRAYIAVAAALASLSGCAAFAPPAAVAVADLQPTQGNGASGTVSFVQKGDRLLVDARVKGLKPGPHGFHVHEKGDCGAPDAMSAGGHFNPTGSAHGSPAGDRRHGGDLGNLEADAGGNAALNATIPLHGVSVAAPGADSIVGRALIVHADPDDFTTQPTGNSGKRVACGVIRLQ